MLSLANSCEEPDVIPAIAKSGLGTKKLYNFFLSHTISEWWGQNSEEYRARALS